MHRRLVVAFALVLAGACSGSREGSDGPTSTTGAAPATSTSPGPAVAVEGEVVRGAAVTVSGAGLTARAGQEVGVLVTALDDDLSYSSGYAPGSPGAVVAPDGTVRLTTFVPPTLNHQGPCKTTSPCDLLPVATGRYRLAITGQGMKDVLARGELNVVRARPGVEYETWMNSECGPPRVDFDGAVWVLTTPRPAQQWDPRGTRGSITVHDPTRAAFTSDRTGTVSLKPADAATMATVGC